MIVKRLLIGHGRKIGVIVLNLLFGHFLFYHFVGFINKHTKKVKNIFMLYPANSKYSRAYVYPWYERQMKWRPRLVGILWQNKKIGFIFGISATEKDFLKKENIENLKDIERKLEKIKKAINAEQKTFAGILPGILFSKKIIAKSPEREVTAKAVLLAVEKVKKIENMENVPLIILGGNGFIGSAVKKEIKNSFSFDIEDKDRFHKFVKNKKGEPAIVLNLTKKGVLKEYIPYLWEGIVVLNEVYPEPKESELRKMAGKNIPCYHIVGSKGGAWPSFPKGYRGGIPCCSSFWPEDGNYNVVVRKL